MKRIILLLIRTYQLLLSPRRGALRFIYFVPTNCKFPETCSDYAYRKISEKGALKGIKLAAKRLAKCHNL